MKKLLLLVCVLCLCVGVTPSIAAEIASVEVKEITSDYIVFVDYAYDGIYEAIEATEEGAAYPSAYFSRRGCEQEGDPAYSIVEYYKGLNGEVYYVVQITQHEDVLLERGKTYQFKFCSYEDELNPTSYVTVTIPKYEGVTYCRVVNQSYKAGLKPKVFNQLVLTLKSNLQFSAGTVQVAYSGQTKKTKHKLENRNGTVFITIPSKVKNSIATITITIVDKTGQTHEYQVKTYIKKNKVEKAEWSNLLSTPFAQLPHDYLEV